MKSLHVKIKWIRFYDDKMHIHSFIALCVRMTRAGFRWWEAWGPA